MSIQKVKFHTDKSELMHFMENLPETFRNEGTTIKNDRNEIKIINYGGLELCDKAFNKVTVFTRFMYSGSDVQRLKGHITWQGYSLKKALIRLIRWAMWKLKGDWVS